MRDVLMYILKRDGISSILKTLECAHRDLHCIDVYYVKDGGYYIARSFYTDAWISAQPIGPKISESGNIIMDTISDVATVRRFEDVSSWKSFNTLDSAALEIIYEALIMQSKRFIVELFQDYSCIVHSVNFIFIPVPSIVVTLVKEEEFLGSVSVDLTGKLTLLNCVNNSVVALVNSLNHSNSQSYYRGFVKCLQETCE